MKNAEEELRQIDSYYIAVNKAYEHSRLEEQYTRMRIKEGNNNIPAQAEIFVQRRIQDMLYDLANELGIDIE